MGETETDYAVRTSQSPDPDPKAVTGKSAPAGESSAHTGVVWRGRSLLPAPRIIGNINTVISTLYTCNRQLSKRGCRNILRKLDKSLLKGK